MWDKRYSEPGYAYGTKENDYLASVVGRIPMGRVLCLGAGEGRNAVFLAKRGYEVTAVDASSVGIEKAQKLATEQGVTIDTVVADLAEYEIQPSAWQGIVSIFCHTPPRLRAAVHKRSVLGLSPGGAFVLEGFTPRQLDFGTGGPQNVQLLMTAHDLRQELAGLRFDIGHEIDREIPKGRYHNGKAAVVQILAFKPAV